MESPGRYTLNLRVCMFIALGRYADAVQVVSAEAPEVLEPDPEDNPWSLLVRLNVVEAVVELGRFDAAERLLSMPQTNVPLLWAGVAVTRAWLLTLRGQHLEAMDALGPAVPDHLGDEYAAEAPMVQAFCLMNLGRADDARPWLDRARKLVVRASSDRNLLLHEARWLVMSGRLEPARECWAATCAHRWASQGGTGMLFLGDALALIGQSAWAREVWARCAQQDPESWAAKQSLERLGPNSAALGASEFIGPRHPDEGPG